MVNAQAVAGSGEGEVMDSQESDRVQQDGRGAFAPIHQVDKGLSNSIFGNARPLGLDKSAVSEYQNPLPKGQRDRTKSLGGRQINSNMPAKR